MQKSLISLILRVLAVGLLFSLAISDAQAKSALEVAKEFYKAAMEGDFKKLATLGCRSAGPYTTYQDTRKMDLTVLGFIEQVIREEDSDINLKLVVVRVKALGRIGFGAFYMFKSPKGYKVYISPKGEFLYEYPPDKIDIIETAVDFYISNKINLDKTIVLVQTILKSKPNDLKANYRLGYLYSQKDWRQKAVSQYRKLITLDKDYGEKTIDPKDLIETWISLLQHPISRELRFYAANELYRIGKTELAKNAWLEMLKDKDKKVRCYAAKKLYEANKDKRALSVLVKEHLPIWKYQTGGDIHSSPAIGEDGTIYVASYDECLYTINPDGTLKWKYRTGFWISSSPAIGEDGTIYVAERYFGSLYAINSDGTLKWKYRAGVPVSSSPAIGEDGTIYVGRWDHCLYAINSDGTLKWKYRAGAPVSSSPAIGEDGTIYVGSNDHYLYAIPSESQGLADSSPWPMFHQNLKHTGRGSEEKVGLEKKKVEKRKKPVVEKGVLMARVSNVDDKAIMYVNGREVITVTWGTGPAGKSIGHRPGDSGWIDITPYLKTGDNTLRFWVWNKAVCCGASGTFEVQVNGVPAISRNFKKQDSTEGVKYDETVVLSLPKPR